MASSSLPLIDVDRLQIGIYVVLDLGWRSHPFLRGSFTIRSNEQLVQLRSLGVDQVRWCPERSIAQPLPEPEPSVTGPAPPPTDGLSAPARLERLADQPPPTESQWQAAALEQLEDGYRQVAARHQQIVDLLKTAPDAAREPAEQLAASLSAAIATMPEPSVRLLSQCVSPAPSAHEIGVTALSLLLGREAGLDTGQLQQLATATLLHDIGKLRLPRYLHEHSGRLTESERRSYRRHVEFGVELARAMALPDTVLRTIAEHHECCDGSGFPAALTGDRISVPGRIIAITNRYHNLLCPSSLLTGLTPYQALQQMYRTERERFDPELLSRFIRIMGVFPPGTLVELTDSRMAIVVASRPGASLSPRVQVIETPDDDASSPIIDIDGDGELRVRHSLAPARLGPQWARRARLLARAPIYVEAQPAREWAAWSASQMEPTLVF